MGAYRLFNDAARIALTERVHWIHRDWAVGRGRLRAALEDAKIHFNEMADPKYMVGASIKQEIFARHEKS